jgi:hypothetical protein
MKLESFTFCNLEKGGDYKFNLFECVTPYEVVVWTSKPFNNDFRLSYQLEKYIHGVVQPMKIITNHIELNIYYDNLSLFKTTFILDDVKQYFDKSIYKYGTTEVAVFIHVSVPDNMRGIHIVSYNTKD